MEGVKELGLAPLPLLDRRGGRDINKCREASTRSGRGGCSNVLCEFEQPPRLCRQWLLRNIFFFGTATPLGKGNNILRSNHLGGVKSPECLPPKNDSRVYFPANQYPAG